MSNVTLQETSALESLQNSQKRFHSRFVVYSANTMGVMIIATAMARNYFTDYSFLKLLAPYLTGVLCFVVGYREKSGKSAKWHAYAIILGIVGVAINAALFNGGFKAPAVAGILLMPMFCTSALGYQGRWIGLAASMGTIAGIMALEFTGSVAPFQGESSKFYPIVFTGIIGISFLIINAYERSRLENEQAILRMNAQLIAADKLSSLGEMASGVAHEINNPLAIIQGKITQMRRQLASGSADTERLLKDAEKIENTVDRISKIILGLRTFSRNSENDEMAPMKFSSIISGTIDLCNERFSSNDVRLSFESKTEAQVNCRASQLGQVVMNLLSNAFDAVTEQKGPEPKWVQVVLSEKDSSLVLTVTDSGHGIPEAIVKKMLDPFFTTKPVGKGTGLGLSICSGIIQGHHGRLEYDSSAPNTRFVVTLPKVS